MTYRPDSKDRKIIYLLEKLTKLGLEIEEENLHRLVYIAQKRGVKMEFEFETINSEGLIFSYELAERLERLANLGYIKRYMIIKHTYNELYSHLYKVSVKGVAFINRVGIAKRDKKILDEIIERIKKRIEKIKSKQKVRS